MKYEDMGEKVIDHRAQLEVHIEKSHNHSSDVHSMMYVYEPFDTFPEPIATQLDAALDARLNEVEDAMRDIARWAYRRIGVEYDYLNSDEYADECLSMTEYDEEGEEIEQ